jgi:DNA (cytosine-5)-methyltransferase 1
MGELVLSIFPGIDLLGRGFEAEGFCIVRGPDKLWGGDVRDFHPPAGVFDGVIGGSPCQDFSRARRTPPTGEGLELLAEFARVVTEASPKWFLLENVPTVPDVTVPGFHVQRIDLNARECGMGQRRLRHFQFGSRDGSIITPDRSVTRGPVEAIALASEGTKAVRRDWQRFCRVQGFETAPDLSSLTIRGRYLAVGNGVPIPMARVLAAAVTARRVTADGETCKCGCGRLVTDRSLYGGAACRKRAERRRRRVNEPGTVTAGSSHS